MYNVWLNATRTGYTKTAGPLNWKYTFKFGFSKGNTFGFVLEPFDLKAVATIGNYSK